MDHVLEWGDEVKNTNIAPFDPYWSMYVRKYVIIGRVLFADAEALHQFDPLAQRVLEEIRRSSLPTLIVK